MELMTPEIQEKLLKNNQNEECDEIVVKYFYREQNKPKYTFYAVSGELTPQIDMILFGYCEFLVNELGYVSLSELESIPTMKRDSYCEFKRLSEVMN